MHQITVYTKPACVQCNAVFRALNNAGIEYQKVDISTDPEARDYVMAWATCKSPSSSPPTPIFRAFAPTASGPSPPREANGPKGQTAMTLLPLSTGYQPADYDEHAEKISKARAQVLADLAAGLAAVERAAAGVTELRSSALHDTELVDGRDGRDVATFLDDSIRLGRAAYAVLHAIIDQELP